MQEPIRILHVLAAMSRAGTETLIMNYYRNIDRNKVQFDFAVSTTDECDYDSEIQALGGRIYRYPQYKGTNHFAYVKWWNEFFKEHGEYSIVHGHIGSTAAIYLKIAKKHGCFAIAHSHNIYVTKTVSDAIYKMFSHPTRRIADYFFGCSEQALIDRYGKKIAADKQRASVLNNAIDAKKFEYDQELRAAVRTELGIDEDTFVVGTVGRLTKQKNPDGIIEIIDLLSKRKDKFIFLWAGRGDCEASIKEKLAEKNLNGCVKLLGVRNDVERIYQAMDVFILPSLYEGLGNVLIEAQAAGLPSFCSEFVPSDVDITELIRHLPLKDYNVWADEILSVETDHRTSTYSDIVNSGYDIRRNAEKLQEFYLLHAV